MRRHARELNLVLSDGAVQAALCCEMSSRVWHGQRWEAIATGHILHSNIDFHVVVGMMWRVYSVLIPDMSSILNV